MRRKRYIATSGQIALGTTAADVCIFSLRCPSSQPLDLVVRRLQLITAFQGSSASSGQSFGISRNTGTAAGGSGTKSGTGIGKTDTSMANSIAELRYGPTAITGLSADSAGDFALAHITHQVANSMIYEIVGYSIEKTDNDFELVISPGITLGIRTRVSSSVSGSILIVNIEWEEE